MPHKKDIDIQEMKPETGYLVRFQKNIKKIKTN